MPFLSLQFILYKFTIIFRILRAWILDIFLYNLKTQLPFNAFPIIIFHTFFPVSSHSYHQIPLSIAIPRFIRFVLSFLHSFIDQLFAACLVHLLYMLAITFINNLSNFIVHFFPFCHPQFFWLNLSLYPNILWDESIVLVIVLQSTKYNRWHFLSHFAISIITLREFHFVLSSPTFATSIFLHR